MVSTKKLFDEYMIQRVFTLRSHADLVDLDEALEMLKEKNVSRKN